MLFQKYSIEKDEEVNLFQKWRHLLILRKNNVFTYVLDTWHNFFQLYVGRYDLLLAGRGLFYLGVAGWGWVWPFFGWVWVSVTFFWLGVCECDLSLAGCGWVWVSARSITVNTYFNFSKKLLKILETLIKISYWPEKPNLA